MCLDLSDVELQGNGNEDNSSMLSLMFLPCHVKESALTFGETTVDSIPDNCNYDQGKFESLYSNVDIIVYSNSPSLIYDKYGNERVKKESSLSAIQINGKQANDISTRINRNLISDETQFI